jgi:hypothetical protein
MGLLLRLIGLLALGLTLAAAWVFRRPLMELAQPAVERILESANRSNGRPSPRALAHARDKVDSLNGWHADSVVLNAGELASLLDAGLPGGARRHLDVTRVALADGLVSVRARVETSAIPRSQLGPLAGALSEWETVEITGPMRAAGPGRGEWQVRSLTIRGITLPSAESARLVGSLAPGESDGAVLFVLPPGVAEFRIRSSGVTLYRERAS